MKKFLSVIIFCLLVAIPMKASASSITNSSIEGKDMVLQGEEFYVDVTIYFEGLGISNGKMLTVVIFEVASDPNQLIIESVSADNFTTVYGELEGVPAVSAVLDETKVTAEENCTNNAFCNTFKARLKVFAKGSGLTELKIGQIGAAVADISKGGENLTEDDIEEVESSGKGLYIKISKASYAIEEPTTQSTTRINRNELKKTTPVVTTQKPTTTAPAVAPVAPNAENPSTTTPAKNEKTRDEEAIKEDQEKRKKMNKKIISYVIIGVVIILLLVIANAIINKIRYRKLDKMLKKF